MVSSCSNEGEIFAGNSGSQDKSSGRKGHFNSEVIDFVSHVILEHTPRISVKYHQIIYTQS